MLMRDVPDQWRPRTGIDIMPFAGVVFVLLVVAMVLTPSITACFAPALPCAGTAEPVPEDALTIEIDLAGGYWLTDQSHPGPIPADRLAEHLRAALARHPGDAPAVLLHADRHAPYASVLPVMRAMQAAGVRRVGLLAERPGPPR